MKKIIAAVVCLAVVLAGVYSFAAGHMYKTVMTVQGEEIPAGLYLVMQLRAVSAAERLAEDEDKDVLKQKIEGQSASTWIREETERNILRYIAVKELAPQYGAVITEGEWEEIESNLSYWTYLQSYYEGNGISLANWRHQLENGYLDDALFRALYVAEDAPMAPDDEEAKELFAELAIHIRYIVVPTTYQGTVEEGEEAPDYTDEIYGIVEDMVAELQGGKSFDEIVDDELEEVYSLLDGEIYVDEDGNLDEVATSHVRYSSTYYNEELMEQFAGDQIGDVNFFQNENNFLVYQVIDTFETEEEYLEMRESVIKEVYTDQYDAYLEEIYSEYKVSKKLGAQWYYRASKMS